MKSLLTPRGSLIVTFPKAYNEYLDKALADEKLGFKEIKYLKRISRSKWIEVNQEDIVNVKYNTPYRSANGLVIGFYKK